METVYTLETGLAGSEGGGVITEASQANQR